MKSLLLFIISFFSLTLTKPDPNPLDAINLNINIPYEKPQGIQESKQKEISDYQDMVFDYGNNGNNNGYIKRRFKDIGYEKAKYRKYGRYEIYGRYGRYGRYGKKATTPASTTLPAHTDSQVPTTTPASTTNPDLTSTPALTTTNTSATLPARVSRPTKGGWKVVGGTKTTVNKYPWIVLLQMPGDLFCGGSVIANKWILTAAHCIHDVISENHNPLDIDAVIGEHDVTTTAETSLTKSESIDKYIIHPQWNYDNRINDIALLRLSRPVDLKVYTPVCLPKTGEDFTGKKAWVYGWGSTEDGSFSDILLDVAIPVVSDELAKQAYASEENPTKRGTKGLRDELLAVALFAGGEAGKDSCKGDSGGPLSLRNRNGKHTQIGIVSFGYGCGRDGLPAVFTDVSVFRQWIDLQIKNNGGVATNCE